MRRCVSRFLIFVSLAVTFGAEKPALESFFPAGGTRGTTNEVTFFGKFDPWPPKVWCSNKDLDFQFSTNKGKGTFIISDSAPTGPCLVRLFNDEGTSETRIFVVSDKSEATEAEPNNHFGRPQLLASVPDVVNGRLEKNGDVDSYSFDLKAGQWLDAALDCYTLIGKIDGVLRLVTTNGYQIAWNHDFACLDPRLVWQAAEDQRVVLQVFGFAYPADSDIRLSGGSGGVYRLNLHLTTEAPADLREQATENEPNDSSGTARLVNVPGELVGTVCPAGDVDRFKVALKKDEVIEAKVIAAAIGSPLDAWCAIENGEGKELARNDDADNSRDPRLEWKAPEDGEYTIAIGSLTHEGSLDCRYHLALRMAGPEYRLISTADDVALNAGATNSLKLNLKRFRGFTNELTAAITGLPEGVSAAPVPLPPKDGEVSIAIVASTNALASNGPFQIGVKDQQTGEERNARFEMVSRTENNGVPGGYVKLQVESTDQLWLTVKKPEAQPSEKK